MSRPDAPFLAFISGVVLAAVAGCGPSSALPVPTGAGAADGATIRNRAIAIAMGRLHTCALLDDHRVKCWGDNSDGQLGLGDLSERGADATTMGDNLPTVDLGTGRTAKSIAAGVYDTCAILDDDTVKCWGGGFYATPNPPDNNIGDEPGEMGDHLKPIDLGAGRKPVAVAIGNGETCVALDDGSLLCWSGGPATRAAAATDGARVVQLAGAPWAVGLFDDGSVRQLSDMWPAGLTPIDLGGQKASFLAGSRMGYCVALQGGGTSCTFDRDNPGHGNIPTGASVVALAITEGHHGCGLDSAGAVTCWQVWPPPTPPWTDQIIEHAAHVRLDEPATALAAADYNACALLADGSVKCWNVDGVPPGDFPAARGGSNATATEWPAVDLGARPAP